MAATANRLERAPWVSDRIGVPVPGVWELAREGKIPVIRIGRRFLFDPQAIEDWLKSNMIAPANGRTT